MKTAINKKEYKVLVDKIFSLKLSTEQTLQTINHLNDVIHEGYEIVCITNDGVVIVQ